MSAFRTTRRAARAIALVYLLRLLVAWIVVSPIARALSSVVARNHPRGDAILFEAGGLELIESLRLSSTRASSSCSCAKEMLDCGMSSAARASCCAASSVAPVSM